MLEQLTRYRRDLHQVPELDFNLPKTLEYISNVLSKYRCTLFSPSPSALCAWFDFGRADAIAFRTDMDGLPITESRKCSYASRHPGKMHACGHDGHMAMILALAEVIDGCTSLPHNVLLLFQPAEETEGGAESIVASGVLEEYGVTRVYGCHLWPDLPEGKIYSKPGPMMAQSSEVSVSVQGLGSHIAKASQGRDALFAATEFVTKVYRMEKAEIEAHIPRLLKFGIFQSGTACNAISCEAHLKGSLRVFDQDTFDFIKGRMEEIASDIEAETGCTFYLHLSKGHLPLINTPALFDKVQRNCGEDLNLLPAPSMTSEDFSAYAAICPIFFFFLGLGVDTPLHRADFDFDEKVLLRGVKFFQKLLLIA